MAGSKILHIGFGKLLDSLKSRVSPRTEMVFQEILQLSSDVHENLLSEGDVFLIGPYTLEPVRQVQRATLQNPLISIVLLIFPEQFNKIKQSVQFAYNISKHITYVSYELEKDITAVLDNAVLRAKQRKSFARITEQELYPKPASPDLTFKNLSAFLDNAPIGAIVFDSKKNIITANHKARQLFHPLLAQLVNVNWSDLFPDKAPSLSNPQTFDGSEPLNEIIKVNNQFLEINISPLKTDDDQPHSLLLLNDVTAKIKAENKLQSKVDELEFLNQELDQFVNVISHDFKTPLTSISLLAELGIKETSREKQLNFLIQIKQSSNKLKELLKGLNVLVDTTKSKSEKIEHVDFQSRFDIVMTDYYELLKQNDGELNVDFGQATDIQYFTAHIDSLFSNLITNAIKYRNKDIPLHIDVKTCREKEYTVLSVKDNGIGIDLEKNMNKLFQPFKRLSDQGTGSGLGLSITKRLIEKNQGYLEVFSTPGKGSEFKVYLKSHS